MLRTLLVWMLLATQKGVIGVAPGPQEPPKTEPFVARFTPMPQPPELPKVDLNSCPFEGCSFGKWTALNPVDVFSSWRADHKQIVRLQRGEVVTALTGANIVLEPARGIFTRDVPELGAKAGDTLYSYQSCGEGAEDIWVHGRFIKCADPNFSWKSGLGCQEDCNGRYLALGKSEWWAEIRLADGRMGWVLVGGHFDGPDGLGG